MLIGEITLNKDCFASKIPSSSAEDLFLQVTSNPSLGLYIDKMIIRPNSKDFSKFFLWLDALFLTWSYINTRSEVGKKA